jgi:hypothetical protein
MALVNNALQEFSDAVDQTVPGLQNLAGSATDVNLAAIFGNGSSVTPGGATAPDQRYQPVATPIQGNPTLTITFGDVTASDPNDFVNQVTPGLTTAIGNILARQQVISSRVNANQYGRQPIAGGG